MKIYFYSPDTGKLREELRILPSNVVDLETVHAFIADFDRCEHGRHQQDKCSGCSPNEGNPNNRAARYAANGDRIVAYGARGRHIWVFTQDGTFERRRA